MFLVILLISSKSFSQVATNDSLVCLPKSLVTKTVQDLTRCDGEREVMKVMQNSLELQEKKIAFQDSVIQQKDLKISDYKATITAYQQVDTAHVRITTALTEKADIYKNERRWWRVAAVIFAIIAIVK